MNWQAAVAQVFPKASPEYTKALNMANLNTMLLKAGILDNPLRTAAFFATVGIESGNMTALRENMNYSAKQIEKVFGVGKHSAGITATEAKTLAGNPAALAERVYGLGNPRKAADLGNTAKGDGFKYRGLGPFQHTGKGAISRAMTHFGVDAPEELLTPALLFGPAIMFWSDRGLNVWADVDDTRAIRKRVNGGYNGYDEFVVLYNKLVALLSDGQSAQSLAKYDTDAGWVQKSLSDLGYPVAIDGKYGPETKKALTAFQRANGLTADGIAGPITKATLTARLSSESLAEPPAVPVISPEAQKATGAASVGLGAAGELVLSTARELGTLGLDSPLLKAIPALLMIVGLGFIVWPMIRGKK